MGLLTRLFGENTQTFLYSVKLHEEFQVLAGYLEFYRNEVFCYINKNYPLLPPPPESEDFAFGTMQFYT